MLHKFGGVYPVYVDCKESVMTYVNVCPEQITELNAGVGTLKHSYDSIIKSLVMLSGRRQKKTKQEKASFLTTVSTMDVKTTQRFVSHQCRQILHGTLSQSRYSRANLQTIVRRGLFTFSLLHLLMSLIFADRRPQQEDRTIAQ